jgi:hypothetical protein
MSVIAAARTAVSVATAPAAVIIVEVVIETAVAAMRLEGVTEIACGVEGVARGAEASGNRLESGHCARDVRRLRAEVGARCGGERYRSSSAQSKEVVHG